jgi:redox-sensitive bicupin YhaK (pirin superfamily)
LKEEGSEGNTEILRYINTTADVSSYAAAASENAVKFNGATMLKTSIRPDMEQEIAQPTAFYYLPATTFPTIHPIHWLHSHFAVGGWSPLQRLGDMLTAHMTQIAPRNGFTWHPHRGLEIYTWVLKGTLHHEDSTGGEGDIGAGELQRMFAGEFIEHQELNHTDQPVRVIQIWFVADPQYRDKQPHYQQLQREQLPSRREGDATIHNLIGGGSPMQQHMHGRLTATMVDPGGSTSLIPPQAGEDVFVYVTDGSGQAEYGAVHALGQYDVILARPDMDTAVITAASDAPLHFLSFYLPKFLK